MKKILILIVSFFASSFCQESYEPYCFHLEENDRVRIENWKYHFGDHPEWIRPEFNDSTWITINPNLYDKDSTGIHFYRARLQLMGEQNELKRLVIVFHGLNSAFEVYWDGMLVGQNGEVGRQKEEEIPGHLLHLAKLKTSWTQPGMHTIAIRFSNYHGDSRFKRFHVHFSYLENHNKFLNRLIRAWLINLGVFAVTAMISLAIFLIYRKNYEFIFFSILNGIILILGVIFISFLLFDMNIQYVDHLDNFSVALGLLYQMMVFFFFLYFFATPKKWIHISINITLMVLVNFIMRQLFAVFNYYDWFYLAHIVVIFVWGFKQRITGRYAVVTGYLLLWSGYFINSNAQIRPYLETLFYIVFTFCMIMAIFMRISEKNKRYEKARLRSQRLETELLKKTIQPHFIMNTLVSIISLISENPKKAVKLIKFLADEFRMINRISSKKQIPLQDELDLCRIHLQLMGYRMDAKYHFKVDGVCEDVTVPPMIFHTLVENGLTHAFKVKESGHFWFHCKQHNGQILFGMKNDGSLLNILSDQKAEYIEEGMGFKYVRARLEESFSSRWKLDYGLDDGLWEVVITINQ